MPTTAPSMDSNIEQECFSFISMNINIFRTSAEADYKCVFAAILVKLFYKYEVFLNTDYSAI